MARKCSRPIIWIDGASPEKATGKPFPVAFGFSVVVGEGRIADVDHVFAVLFPGQLSDERAEKPAGFRVGGLFPGRRIRVIF